MVQSGLLKSITLGDKGIVNTSIQDILKPIGWTRQSNVEGYMKGTYDVLAVWSYGPDQTPLSTVAMYTEQQVEEILSIQANKEK